ncbi:MAG: hypothetical protein ACT4P5_11280 [Armatimonadota bacterium]
MSRIGTLRETPLHAALKGHLAQAGDKLEAPVAGCVVDILRGDVIFEIQTAGFAALRRKLPGLLERHRVRLVYPIALERWIVSTNMRGTPVSRRKSPRRGRLEHLFLELVSFPELATHPNLAVDVLLVREEVVRGPALSARRYRQRRYHAQERRLLEVVEHVTFASPDDYRRFLPPSLPHPFSCRDLAEALEQPAYVAQKIAYSLRKMGLIVGAGRRGQAPTYVAREGACS